MSQSYAYPSDVSDDEWVFGLPYLVLSAEDSGSRKHSPWKAVHDQAARWHAAGVFEALIADLRGLMRLGEGRS
jgi:hypothetical protein